MKYKVEMIFLCFIVLSIIPRLASAKNVDVVVIGIVQGSAPAFEESLDKKIRENLSNTHELDVADYLKTQNYRKKILFDECRSVSEELVESLKKYCNDSTVFIWGEVKSVAIKGVRRKAIFGYIRGEMVISLNIYSLRYKNFAFCGDITTEFEKKKEFLFFGAAEDEIIPSIIDRNKITGTLIDRAALQAADMISTVIKSEQLHNDKEHNPKKYKIISASGASVNQADSTTGKEAAKPGPSEQNAKSEQQTNGQ
jgi:hypothetical protein